MRKIGVSSTLTVYHDGQFWVGAFECVEDGKLSVCRIVFGAEPSDEEIQEIVCKRWNHLRFTRAIALEDGAPKPAANPKRRQREAARELRKTGPSSKTQQALSEKREALAQQRKADDRERREREKHERFERCREKRKRKHKGH